MSLSNHYSFEQIVSKYQKILSTITEASIDSLKRTQFAKNIHEKRNKLVGKRQCQCFENYLDSDAHILFKAYGMGDAISREAMDGKLAPWVEDKSFIDPHKGKVENKGNDLLITNGWLF